MAFSFFAVLSRMKNIHRWALMRNTRQENIAEHSYETAVLAHVLAEVTNRHYGGDVDASRCVMLALYHDATEILTGDLPTPVKYFNPAIRQAYRDVESHAADSLLSMLPQDMQNVYAPWVKQEGTSLEKRIVKAADKLSALIKCVEELGQGNREFASARRSTEQAIREMDLPAALEFLEQYIPAYELPLDDQ